MISVTHEGGTDILGHGPEKWVPVFRKGHAQTEEAHGPEKWVPVFRQGHAQMNRASATGVSGYFLRKRSIRTTVAPSLPRGGSPPFSAGGVATGRPEAGGTAGRLAEAGISPAISCGSNCRPNCTEGSKKLLIEANGTTSRSGTPPNDSPTSKRSSVTTRSQNWCCRMIVISSGDCASSRGDSLTPSAFDRKVMKK